MTIQPALVGYSIAGLLLATGVLHVLYMRYFHPLARFSGPFIASISNVYYALLMLSGNHHRKMLKLHRLYVRITPNELSFSSLTSRDDIKTARKFLKSLLYKGYINRKEPSLVGVKDPILHGEKRRFLSHAFSAKALKSHEETINSYADLFVQQAAIHGGGSEGINMTRWYNWFSFDVVGDLGFRASFNCLKHGKQDLKP